MPSIWANFNHVFEVFQGLFFAFLLLRKDALGTSLISHGKTFFPCTLRLVMCFQYQGMVWKTEECYEKQRQKSRFWFSSAFVYFAALKTIYFAPVPVVAASCFNYIDPCRWFQLVLDGFSSSYMVLGGFSLFLRWSQLVLDGFRSFRLFQVI